MSDYNREIAEVGIIRPEQVAAKLAAIRNYEYPALLRQITERPELVDLLMWIQAMSLRPGGLVKLASEVLEEFSDQLGTHTMRGARGKLSLEQKLSVFSEMPRHARPSVVDVSNDPMVELLTDCRPNELEGLKDLERRALRQGLSNVDLDEFKASCKQSALHELPRFLRDICIEPGKPIGPSEQAGPCLGAWYFEDIIGTLFEYMSRRAARIQARIAMTAVSSKVFETMDEAHWTKLMFLILGDSRFGKTESLTAYCDMWPGRVRLVKVKSSNSLRELIVEAANALGIETSFGSSTERLRAKVSYVLQHTGLSLAFDEGAWLFPQSFSKNTPPNRLNWVRSELFDRNLPVVICATPDWWDTAKGAFVAKTHYNIDQFTGRCEEIKLAAKLDESDLIKVAAVHFPEITAEEDLVDIGSYANYGDNFLQAIGNIEKRARYYARKEGKRVTMSLVKGIIDKMYPPAEQNPAPAVEAAGAPPKADQARSGNGLKTALRASARGVKPRGNRPAALEFPSGSLRDAGPESVSAELVSAGR